MGAAALDLLLPPEGYDPGAHAPQTAGFSASAWMRIAFLDEPVCDGVRPTLSFRSRRWCALPRVRSPATDVLARARAACLYDEHFA